MTHSQNFEGPNPGLSVVLVTPGRFAMVRRTVRHLRDQSIADRIELVLVAPSASTFDDVEPGELDGFAGVVRVETGSPILCVNRASAPGIRAASAPIVALVEDHAFPVPGWAESLIQAYRGPWSAVGMAMANANPFGGLSWTNILIAYGRWLEPDRGFEVDSLPGHNVSYRREVMLELFGDRLEAMMARDSGLHQEMRAKGHRMYVEPGAEVAHLNPSQLGATATLRFQAGRLYGGNRAVRERWPLWKRLLYIATSPLIPFVRFSRFYRDFFRAGAPQRRLWPRIAPALLYGLALDGAGQALGYAFGPGATRERLARFEIDRWRHLSRRDLRLLAESSPAAEQPAGVALEAT